MTKAYVPPAPELRFGLCTDCRIPPIVAGDGDLKVCPRCHALLWRKDYSSAQHQKRLEAAKLAAEREALRRAKATAKEGAHQIIPKPPDEIPS